MTCAGIIAVLEPRYHGENYKPLILRLPKRKVFPKKDRILFFPNGVPNFRDLQDRIEIFYATNQARIPLELEKPSDSRRKQVDDPDNQYFLLQEVADGTELYGMHLCGDVKRVINGRKSASSQ